MTSRPKCIPKTDKNYQRSLEERLDHLTTTVEAQQNILDRFMALYESEKLMTLSQGEDNEKKKTDAIVTKDTEIVKMRREILNMKLTMERQTAIYVRDKMTWEQERDQLQKLLERYKTLSEWGPIDNSSTQIIPFPPFDAPKFQFTTKDLTKTHKCTDCNEFSTDLKSYLEFHRSVGCNAAPRYNCTVCNKQFLRKDNYDRHAATHANKDAALRQIQGIEDTFARNKRRQAIREEYQHEFNMFSEPKEKKETKPLPDAFSTYDFQALDMNLKGTLLNMEQMRQLEPTSAPPAAAGPKQADSQKVQQNTFSAPTVISVSSLRNLASNSPIQVFIADQKQTVNPEVEKQVPSMSNEAGTKIPLPKGVHNVGVKVDPTSVIIYPAGQKQTVNPEVAKQVPSTSDKTGTKIVVPKGCSNIGVAVNPTSVSVYTIPPLQNGAVSSNDKDGIKMAPNTMPFSITLNLKPAPGPASAADQKQNEVPTPSDQAAFDEAAKILYSLKEEFKPILVSTAEKKQTAEQTEQTTTKQKLEVKQDVVPSPKDESKIEKAGKGQARSASINEDAKPSSALFPPASYRPVVVQYIKPAPPKSDPIGDSERRYLRQRFDALLLRHPCTNNSACSILAFRGYAEHASQCHDGPDCSWYICKRVQAKTEHLKTCKDKLDCTFCQPYIYFNDYKMQGMMRVLEKGCPLNRNRVGEMSESMRESIMLMVARLAVNYGLVGDDEKPKNDDDNEVPEEVIDVETVSSSSEFSSSSSESSEDEEEGEEESSADEKEGEGDSSGGEKTAEEWEIVDPERYYEVD